MNVANGRNFIEQRLAFAERDVMAHAKTLTAHNDNLNALNTSAVRAEEKEKARDERLERIENAVAGIYRLGWWLLATFGAIFCALVANFVFRGGLVA